MVVCAASHGVTVFDLGDAGLRGTEAGVLPQETNICRHMASRSWGDYTPGGSRKFSSIRSTFLCHHLVQISQQISTGRDLITSHVSSARERCDLPLFCSSLHLKNVKIPGISVNDNMSSLTCWELI